MTTDNLLLFLDGACFIMFMEAIILMLFLDSFNLFGKEFSVKKVGFTRFNITYLIFYSLMLVLSLARLVGWF